MKTTRRIMAMVLCLALALSLAVPAMAAGETYDLTIKNSKPNHTYEAYQIFAGELANVDGKVILSDVEWGASIPADSATALLAAINADTTLTALHGATDAKTLAEKVATLTDDSDSLIKFADIVANVIKTKGTAAYKSTSTQVGDEYVIEDLSAGYYLIKDKDVSLGDANDIHTQYILRVLKDAEIKPKGDVPTVEKKINDTLGGTYTDVKDFDINDTAYYKWTGTLASNIKYYDTYSYKFTDTLPTGIEFLRLEQVYLEGHDSNIVHTFYDESANPNALTVAEINDKLPTGITLAVSGKTITLDFNNLLTLYTNIQPTHKVVVKYTARVTRDALIGEAMENEVYVDFSNDPDGTGTGRTEKDEVYAFTFQINVDKYDADNKEKKLEGAEFKLYYERTVSDTQVKYFAKVITEEMAAAGEIINGTAVDADDVGIVYGWTTNEAEASVLDTNKDGELSVKGLDEGIYYLKETKAPAGYNLMETPVMIKIIPTYTVTGDTATVEVKYEVDSKEQDSNTVGVRNSSGSTLPSTGGMGTTLFYVFGTVMALGAAVLLITKKRMLTAE